MPARLIEPGACKAARSSRRRSPAKGTLPVDGVEELGVVHRADDPAAVGTEAFLYQAPYATGTKPGLTSQDRVALLVGIMFASPGRCPLASVLEIRALWPVPVRNPSRFSVAAI
ncbi:MAG: hypothetical protein JO022_10655 [Acidobacteriaceae bacterium]|nr:hypothetical protein [Acidobacteriaceae bacterium]